MAAVCGTEGVVHIYVGVGSESLGKFFLTLFHFLLGCVVAGIFFVDTHGLTLFFGIEAEVFEEEHLTGFKSLGLIEGLAAVFGKFHFGAECLGYGILDLAEGELGVDLAFGLAHVAHDDE